MKRLTFSICILISLMFLPFQAANAVVTYNCTALTGGAARALDYLSVSDLSNGDRALVAYTSGVSTYLGVYQYDSSGTTTENTSAHPYYVRPNDYATGGVWCELSLSWVDLLTSLTIANLTVTGTNTVVNLDASGRLTGALVVTDLITGTTTLSGVSQRGGLAHNLNATSHVTFILSPATMGDSAIFVLAKNMISGSTMTIIVDSSDRIINYSTFKTGNTAGTSYYLLSSSSTSGVTGEGISVISPKNGIWYIYEDGSPSVLNR